MRTTGLRLRGTGPRMRRAVTSAMLGFAALLALAASASAGTVSIDADGLLAFQAARGETNDVTVRFGTGEVVVVRDTAARITTREPGCAAV